MNDELLKEKKRELKSFKLEKKIDYIVYLQELIARTDKCLVKINNYLINLNERIEDFERNKVDEGDCNIPIEEYSFYVDLLGMPTVYILNLIGDNQKVSISYRKFRHLIDKKKKNGSLEFEIKDLDDEVEKIVLKLNKKRNWMNHVPESLLMSEIELIKEGKLRSHSMQPIEIFYQTHCKLSVIKDLYMGSKEFYNSCRIVHQSMKKDYSSLIGESVRVSRIYSDKAKNMDFFEATELSAEIQGL